MSEQGPKPFTWKQIQECAIPMEEPNRLNFLAGVDICVTGFINQYQYKDIKIAELCKVYDKVNSFYLKHRVELLSPDHRLVMYMIISKMCLLLFRITNRKGNVNSNGLMSRENSDTYGEILKSKGNGPQSTLEILAEHGVDLRHVDFDTMAMDSFWTITCILTEEINNLRYIPEMETIMQIMTCIYAEYVLIETKKGTRSKVQNLKKFTKNHKGHAVKDVVVVDKLFMQEFERCAYGYMSVIRSKATIYGEDITRVIDLIFEKHDFKTNRIVKEFVVDIPELSKKMDRILKAIHGPVKENAETDLAQLLYEATLVIGEREKHEEKYPIESHEAYNILCKFRAATTVDQVNKWINNNPFEYIAKEHVNALHEIMTKMHLTVERITINTPKVKIFRYFDVGMELAIGKLFKMKYSNYDLTNYIVNLNWATVNTSFPNKYIYDICNTLAETSNNNCNSDEEFESMDMRFDNPEASFKSRVIPLLIKCVDEWYCIDVKRGIIYATYTFISCFVKWIELAISDKDLDGVLPDDLDLKVIATIINDISYHNKEDDSSLVSVYMETEKDDSSKTPVDDDIFNDMANEDSDYG